MKKTLVILLIIIGAIIIIKTLIPSEKTASNNIPSFEEYIPSENFRDAFLTLSKDTLADKDYDIEETVRIIHAIEIAQAKSTGFVDFLEYLSQQDYSKVAPEVIKAKLKLLPIFQEMHNLEKEYLECYDIWSIASSVIQTTLEENDYYISKLYETESILHPLSKLDQICSTITLEYINKRKIKADLEDRINIIKSEYIEYLYSYTPIYNKFMNEWNKLCLLKDKTYLNLYSGNIMEASNLASNILKQYPQNREAILLQALSLVNIIFDNVDDNFATPMLQSIERITHSKVNSTSAIEYTEIEIDTLVNNEINIQTNLFANKEALMIAADNLMDYYIDLYPDKSAPALLIKGLLNYRSNKTPSAIAYFDQASIEYVQQSEQLTDLLDSYVNRDYLNKTPEGQYLLKLYKSTMGGFGMFSPNFWKADLYMKNGESDLSQGEIFKHYFRRGNQSVYDCMLSDLQYCEEYLYSSFKQVLIEQSYLDLNVKPSKNWGVISSDDKIDIKITNRSDLTFENIRVFLCIHYTDMYKDEYDIVKVPLTKNRIEAYSTADMGQLTLTYENKKYPDITRIRAIALTDDKICWVDDVDYKANETLTTLNNALYGQKKLVNFLQKGYLKDFSMDSESVRSLINDNVKVTLNKTNLFTKNELIIELPRKLALLDPLFSLNQVQDKENSQQPKDNKLIGDIIRLKFNIKENTETYPLYMYSKFFNLKMEISVNDDTVALKSITLI